MEIDIWKIDENKYKIYTDDFRLIKFILDKLKKSKVSSTYIDNGIEVGWDVTIPSEFLNDVKLKAKELKK